MATIPRITVHQGLFIAGIEHDGTEVKVLVAGGCSGWSGTVTYDFTDPANREAWMARLRDWRDEGHPVTVVERNGEATIVDEQALINSALEASE